MSARDTNIQYSPDLQSFDKWVLRTIASFALACLVYTVGATSYISKVEDIEERIKGIDQERSSVIREITSEGPRRSVEVERAMATSDSLYSERTALRSRMNDVIENSKYSWLAYFMD